MSSSFRPIASRLGPLSRYRSRSLVCKGHAQRVAVVTQFPARRFISTSTSASTPPDFSAPKQARALTPIILAVFTLISGTGYWLSTPPSRPDTLNDRFFVPYTITAREAISPTSFVFTVEPDTPNPSHPYLLPKDSPTQLSPAQWRWPLWSVEFRQPEVQIARHYTPLPPREGDDPTDGTLRFYIRTVGDGEMSQYLARRQVGHLIHIRGPHPGFELAERLGDMPRVVFLAGGTGVAPGLQAAKAVLESSPNTTFDLLWAVRKREEIQQAPRLKKMHRWKFWAHDPPTELDVAIQNPSPVAQQLSEMKAKYGKRLRIQVVVDEEHTKFQSKHLEDTIITDSTHFKPTMDPFKNGCRFHDQTMHIGATEYATPEAPGCTCPSMEGFKPGKNLFIVSGPDGFIQHYAGQKIWVGGHQTQGPVGGVIGHLRHQHPQLAEDWLVLKM